MAGENVPKSTQAYFFDPQMEDYNHLKYLFKKGEKNMAKSCIEKGFPLNKDYADKTYDGTPLHLAVSLEYPDIVELLLEKGAYVNSRNDNNETPLMLAAIIGNRQITDIFLTKLGPCNYWNDHRFSHFHIVCMQNNMDLVQKFLTFGADVNEPVSKKSFFWPGFTPLHFAVEFRSIETAKLLIEKGANITIQDSQGSTPLHLAFRKKNRLLTDLLLSKQYYCASNPVDPDGLSHFHIACAFNKKGIVEDFLDKQINLRNILPRDHLLNRHGYNGFQFAIRNQCIDVLECLLKCDAFTVERDESSVIDYAYERKNENILNLVISYVEKDMLSIHSPPSVKNVICEGIPNLDLVHESNNKSVMFEDLKRFNVSQYSELHVAVLQKDNDQINSILDRHHSSIILLKDAREKTPLHLAFETKQNHLIDKLLLLHLHLDENPKDSNNLSHFHISCATQNVSIVDEFIKKGADINMKINMDSPIWAGNTPLHIAVVHRQIKVMKSLLDNGADFTLKNALDLSPYELAIPANYLELIVGNHEDDYKDWDAVEQILLANERRKAANFDDRGITLLHVASANNNVAMIQRYASPSIINKTTDENLPHCNGFTALHFAAQFEDAVKVLLNCGADPAIQNCEKYVAGHYSECKDNRLYLVSKNYYNDDGVSIFHKACQFGNIEVIEHFLDMEANVVHTRIPHTCQEFTNGDEGKAPLHLAVEANNPEVVKLLLERGADVNARDCYFNTPLHFCRSKEVLEILLNRGADPEALNYKFFTALERTLHYCCEPDFVTAVVENGWDINKRKLKFTDKFIGSNSNVLAKQMERLTVIGVVMNQRNLKLYHSRLRNNSIIRKKAFTYKQKCAEELNLMKEIEVDNRTTLYDLLFKSLSEMTKYSRNETFRKIVESEQDLRQKYPIYAYLIILQFKKGLKRSILIEQGKKSLTTLANQWMGDLVLETILEFMNDHEITYLNYAVSGQKIFQSIF